MASVVEEIEYEGLENGSIGINMLAGAMAGISEHAVMYPVDSIKVSDPIILSFRLPLRLASFPLFHSVTALLTRPSNRPGCKSFRPHRPLYIVIWPMHLLESLRRKERKGYGEGSPQLLQVLDLLMLCISERTRWQKNWRVGMREGTRSERLVGLEFSSDD